MAALANLRLRVPSRGIVIWMTIGLFAALLVAPFKYDFFAGAVVLTMVAGLLAVLVLPRMLPAEDRKFATKLLALGLLIKLVGIGLRLWFAAGVYGYGDSERYSRAGADIADLIRAGQFAMVFHEVDDGTRFMEVITGFVFVVTGSSWFGGSVVFGFFAFVGVLFFYRAFCMAFPSSNHRLALALLMFFPSVFFWPSTVGKEAVLVFSSGLATYGIATMAVNKKFIGLVPFAVGVVLAYELRAPVGLALIAGFVPAVFIVRPRFTLSGWFWKLTVMVVILVMAPLFIRSTLKSIDVEDPSIDTIVERITTETNRDYDEATGSNYQTLSPTDPMWVPTAVVTVLIRPFPWEARTIQALLQSADSMLTGLIIFVSAYRLVRYGGDFRSRSFLAYLLAATLALILVHGVLGNFGLLARQRSVLMPFLLLLLAIPGPRSAEVLSEEGAQDDLQPARTRSRRLKIRVANTPA